MPIYAAEVINALENAGFEAYAAGGCVRDSLLGRPPTDWDVATSALPEQVKQVFPRVADTGIKHGTVAVLTDVEPVEVTTFRTDGVYTDYRRPDTVTFVKSLEDDLARRDFTINAMAWSERRGLVDIFGGQRDLKNKMIRCVGDAETRFTEDALRILRALRFSATLDFKIEHDTEEAATLLRSRLSRVSAERVSSELLKLLCGPGAGRVIVRNTDILGVWLPELLPMRGFDQRHPCHHFDVLEHTAAVVDAAPATPEMRLAALLHDIGKPRCYSMDERGTGHFKYHAITGAAMSEKVCARLKLDRETSERVRALIRWHDYRSESSEKAVRRRLNRISPELFFKAAELCRADMMGKTELGRAGEAALDESIRVAHELIERGECLYREQLAVNGRDLAKLGIPGGPEVGRIIDALLDAVLDGELPNEKEILLEKAAEMKRN